MTFLEKLSGGALTLATLFGPSGKVRTWTQAEFAGKLGTRAASFHIENGRKVVSPERAARWASLWAMRSLSLYGLRCRMSFTEPAFDTP